MVPCSLAHENPLRKLRNAEARPWSAQENQSPWVGLVARSSEHPHMEGGLVLTCVVLDCDP